MNNAGSEQNQKEIKTIMSSVEKIESESGHKDINYIMTMKIHFDFNALSIYDFYCSPAVFGLAKLHNIV